MVLAHGERKVVFPKRRQPVRFFLPVLINAEVNF